MAGLTMKMANVQLQMAEMVKQARKFARGSWCTVGIHANVKDVRQRKEDAKAHGKKASDVVPSNAEVAAWNHFGTEKIPARPFLDVAVVKNKAVVAGAAKEVLAKGGSVSQAVGAMGAMAAGKVQQYIADIFIPPPNSPRTIARKGSSHPLIDTGQMRQSITWQRTKK